MEKQAADKSRGILWVCLALTLLWIGFIFLHSLQNGEDSSQESGAVWELLSKIFPSISHGLVRKLGHLTEFTILGCLLAALFRSKSLPERGRKLPAVLRCFVLPAGCGLLVAMCDEIIQTGVPGRSGEWRDVLIDFSGVLLGVLLVSLISQVLHHLAGADAGK